MFIFSKKHYIVSTILTIMLIFSFNKVYGQTGSGQSTVLSYKYPFPFRIYLPSGYSKDSEYPVLYLLHGQGQTEFLWENLGLKETLDSLIESDRIQPMIVVMPRETYYYQNMDESDFPDAFLSQLIPVVENSFSIAKDRESRMIGGISRGALWAQKAAFENIDMFSAVGAHSLPNPFFSDYMLNKYIKQFGDYSVPDIYIDTGDLDPYAKGSSDFSIQLFQLKIPHILSVTPGTHDDDYWSENLEDYLLWYGKSLAN
ncbi:MAG: hypothetical protein IJI14_06140 [Anaerolineaceae bacterium]|nr:hypothetical protein [Anaerolineaceae bacterium]